MARDIEQLDPVRDPQRIMHLVGCYEFPFDTTRALEFALFRTFCVPAVSELLDRTGEFVERAQKRYDDTDLIVSELIEYGYDSERGKNALRRMNQLHGRFAIANEDFLYVLSTFVFEPIRWNARFGWRLMSDKEKLGQFYFWREVGRRMNIKDLPDDYDRFDAFNRTYERERFHYTPSNGRVGWTTLEMFASWFPRISKPLARRVMFALMDDAVIDGFRFPKPKKWWRRSVENIMRLRAWFVSWLPARKSPRLRTELRHRTYPRGYRIDELGPTA